MAPIVGRLTSVRGGRDGAIAQLGERVVRNDEVGGSIPPGSTSLRWLRQLRLGKPWCAKLSRHSPKGDGGLVQHTQTFACLGLASPFLAKAASLPLTSP